MSAPAAARNAGQLVLGRYRIVQCLARGGTGVLYLGRVEGRAGFSRPVVIKRIIDDAGDREASKARFVREAQILSSLQHPGIVGVLDFGEERDGHSIVLEYVHGYDLGHWLEYLELVSRPVDWEEATYITLRVLDALTHAHDFRRSDGTRATVLHRDICPGNVLMDLDGRVRLLDFGIARMGEAPSLYEMQTGMLESKAAFLAPELFASGPPSIQSDLYACGVVLYQMLAGTNPFIADNDSKLMWRVLMDDPRPLSAVRDDLPESLEVTIFTALAKDPEERQESAAALADELRASLVRDEVSIQASLRERLRADFNGDMPQRLKLERLSERDRAWRGGEDVRPPLASMTARKAVQDVGAPMSVPVQSRGERTPRAARSSRPTTRPSARAVQQSLAAVSPTSVRPPEPASSPYKPMVVLGLSLGTIMAAVMAAALFYLERGSPSESRFSVVERPTASGRTPVPSLGASAPATPEPPPSGPAAASVPLSQDTGGPQPAPDPGGAVALSRRFARQEGALEACFERHAASLEGQPQIAVKFDVAASGVVKDASLSPASLTPTPLGRCLTGVARATDFGDQEKPLRFTIPIRANSAQR
jgi:serine/threonine protein kinase